jgi:hypothetical protein
MSRLILYALASAISGIVFGVVTSALGYDEYRGWTSALGGTLSFVVLRILGL